MFSKSLFFNICLYPIINNEVLRLLSYSLIYVKGVGVGFGDSFCRIVRCLFVLILVIIIIIIIIIFLFFFFL